MYTPIPNKMTLFLWHFVKKQPVTFFVALISAFSWSLNEMFFPYFIKLIVNTITGFHGDPHHVYQALLIPIVALVFCWILMEISQRIQGLVLAYGFPKFRAHIRESAFRYISHHSHHYFANHFAGSIAQKLSSLPNSCQNVVEIVIFTFFSIIVALITAFTLMWLTHPTFSLILLTWFCLHMGIALLFLHRGNARWEAHAKAVTTLSGKIVDSITNNMSMRLFARNAHEMSYIGKVQADEIKKSHHASLNMELMRLIQGLCGVSFIFSMLFTLIHGLVILLCNC